MSDFDQKQVNQAEPRLKWARRVTENCSANLSGLNSHFNGTSAPPTTFIHRGRAAGSFMVISETKSEERLPQLDSLRAFAIGGAMICHSPVGFFVQRYLPVALGVQLFFVLSGFLITRILLQG